MNFLQLLAEAIFFFHPVTWWVSAWIRDERERCCDDVAVAACDGDAKRYTRALLDLEGLRSATMAAATGLGASDGPLYERVRRLVAPRRRASRKLLPSAGLILALTGLLLGERADAMRIEAASSVDPLREPRRVVGEPGVLRTASEFWLALGREVTVRADGVTIPRALEFVSERTGLVFDIPESARKAKLDLAVEALPARRLIEALFARKEIAWRYEPERRLVVAHWWEAPGPVDRHAVFDNNSVLAWEELSRRNHRHVDFDATGSTLVEALEALAERTGITFTYGPHLEGHHAHGEFHDVRVFDVYEQLLNDHGLTARYDDAGRVHAVPANP